MPTVWYPTDERKEVRVRKTPYVRFDNNDYSVPHTLVQKHLVLLASEHNVRILDKDQVVAEHERSYDKGAQIEEQSHINELVKAKRRAKRSRGMDRLHQAVQRIEALFISLAERGENLGAATNAFLRLLDQYGAQRLETAIVEALERGTPHPHSVRHILERRCREAKQTPPIPVNLPDDPRIRDIHVKPHSLETYDYHKEEESNDEQVDVSQENERIVNDKSREPRPMGSPGTLG